MCWLECSKTERLPNGFTVSNAVCHPNRFAKVISGLCGSCYDKELRARNQKYRESQRANSTAWRRRNPEKVRANYERRKARMKLDPLYERKRHLKVKYGWTLYDYCRQLKLQRGGCAICRRKPGERPLHIDHSHKTNKVRGLLCHQCNWYLGVIERNKKVLKRIAKYLGEI